MTLFCTTAHSQAAFFLEETWRILESDPAVYAQLDDYFQNSSGPSLPRDETPEPTDPTICEQRIGVILKTLSQLWDFISGSQNAWKRIEKVRLRFHDQEVPLCDAVFMTLDFFRPFIQETDRYVH